jgi:hypothetical protein
MEFVTKHLENLLQLPLKGKITVVSSTRIRMR